MQGDGCKETSIHKSDGCQVQLCTDFNVDARIDKPNVGMEFDTYDALVEYFARYARQEGFVVSKRTSKKGKDGIMRYVVVTCYKGGKPRERGARILKPRPQSKLDCPVRIPACLSSNAKWQVKMVCLEHNHEQSPEKARHLSGNRRIDDETKKKLVFHDLAGIKLNKTFDVIQIESGGPENLTFSQSDCRNYLSKARSLRLVEGDAEAMNRYFIRMKADNEAFFYALDLNEKGPAKECLLG